MKILYILYCKYLLWRHKSLIIYLLSIRYNNIEYTKLVINWLKIYHKNKLDEKVYEDIVYNFIFKVLPNYPYNPFRFKK